MNLITLVPLLLAAVPWATLAPLAAEVIEGKATRTDFVQAIPAILDDSVHFDDLIPGQLGDWLESLDGPVFTQVVEWVADHSIARAKRHATKAAPATPVRRPGAAFLASIKGRHLQPPTV